jgi:hypothetical protein
MTTEEVGVDVASRLIVAMVSLGAASICTLRIIYNQVSLLFFFLTGFLYIVGLAGLTGTARILIEEIQIQDALVGYVESITIGLEVPDDKSWKYDSDDFF